MRTAIFATLAAAALLACGPGRSTFARYPGAPAAFDRSAQDPKALEIADKVVAAAGGTATWSTAKQLRWQQVISQDGKELLAGEQAWDRWNGRHYGRAKREGGDMVVMRDIYQGGGNAFIDNGQKLKKIDGGADQAVKTSRERWEFDTGVLFIPFLLEEPGTKLEYGGEVQGDDGKPRDLLKVSFDPKERQTKYQLVVNRDTNLIERIEIQQAGKSEDERLGYAVTQWIDAKGMKLPGTLENLGMKGEVVTYKDVTVGDPDEDLYVPPPML
ncbi:MAG: hypothetical protein HOV81_29875 [Kofleriaceae bacterium]|nr:hypothetical protein [Kofleriaceae bacterium]